MLTDNTNDNTNRHGNVYIKFNSNIFLLILNKHTIHLGRRINLNTFYYFILPQAPTSRFYQQKMKLSPKFLAHHVLYEIRHNEILFGFLKHCKPFLPISFTITQEQNYEKSL